MALSGSINTNKYSTQSSGTIGLNLSWTGTQSIVDNSTTISWTLKSNGTMTSGYCVWGGPITVVIGGKTVLSQTSRIRVYGSGAYKKTGTVIIPHNEDGTKSISMSVRAALYNSEVNCTASGNYTLDPITRYALLSSVTNFTDEVGTNGYPTITYVNPAGTELVSGLKARITWNEGANTTSWVTLNDEGGTYTFTSSTLTAANITSMLSACPTSNSLPIQFDLQSTLDSTEFHHCVDAVMTVVNANPTSGAVTFQDTNSTVVGKTGSNQIIVQGQSTLKIMTANSTAKKSATISSYSLTFNGTTTDITANKYLTITQPNLAGVYPATVTTTDSRGNTSSATVNITIYELVPPSAIYSLQRVDNFYTNTTLYVEAQISSINGTNTGTITEKHKKKTDSTWSTPTTVQNATATTLALDNTYEWEVQIMISDEYYTGGSATTYTASVGVGLPIAFFDKKRHSVSVNGFPTENNQLFVGGNILATKNSGETSIRAYRSDTDIGVRLQVDALGEKNGVYSETYEGYIIHSDLLQRVYVGEKPFGGYELWDGSLKTGSFDVPWGYNVYIVEVDITNNASRYTGAVIPACWILQDTDRQYCVTDEAKYIVFKVKRATISGEDRVVVTFVSCTGTGGIRKLFGIN